MSNISVLTTGDGMAAISEFDSFEQVIENTYGKGITVKEKRRVSGGDINEAFLLILSDGNSVFLKENTKENADFFSAEKDGLKALLETKTIGVPKVHSFGKYERKSFLLMDYLQPAKQDKRFWENFGHALAEMHKADTTALLDSNESDIKKYGFYRNNYIGAGHQKNTPKETWIGFFRDCRIMPQLKRAEKKLPSSDIKKIEHIMDDLDRYLIEPEKPSLLHGDLWSGNFVAGPDGNAWLIDPAVYVGCSEADIAMTELFGGFSGTFYGTYRESGLIMPGYEERRDLYNLYHMLNHLNLFGSSYLYAVERIISGY